MTRLRDVQKLDKNVQKSDELLAAVYCKLYGDGGDDGRDLAMTLPGYYLGLAKHEARNGNLAPLRKLYPEIAEFLAKPAVKRVRQFKATIKSIRTSERHEQADTVRRIRKILQQETGQARVDAELVTDIAARVLKCEPNHIREIIKRG